MNSTSGADRLNGKTPTADDLLDALPGGDELVSPGQTQTTMRDVCQAQSLLLAQVIQRARRLKRSANPRVRAEGVDLLRLLGQHD